MAPLGLLPLEQRTGHPSSPLRWPQSWAFSTGRGSCSGPSSRLKQGARRAAPPKGGTRGAREGGGGCEAGGGDEGEMAVVAVMVAMGVMAVVAVMVTMKTVAA